MAHVFLVSKTERWRIRSEMNGCIRFNLFVGPRKVVRRGPFGLTTFRGPTNKCMPKPIFIQGFPLLIIQAVADFIRLSRPKEQNCTLC